jgi:hypothetical protein
MRDGCDETVGAGRGMAEAQYDTVIGTVGFHHDIHAGTLGACLVVAAAGQAELAADEGGREVDRAVGTRRHPQACVHRPSALRAEGVDDMRQPGPCASVVVAGMHFPV